MRLVFVLSLVLLQQLGAAAQSPTPWPDESPSLAANDDVRPRSLSREQKLARLADRFEAAGRDQEASQVRSWHVPVPDDRQLMFLIGPKPDKKDKSEQIDNLADRFRELRDEHADRCFADAQETASHDPVSAYQGLYEVLRENPQHAEARRIVGMRTNPVRVTLGKTSNNAFGWKAGQYWRAHSDHFTITTNHSRQAAFHMVQLLERLHQVWRQLFVLHWTDGRSVAKAFHGRRLVWPARRPHQVVLFASRADFIKHLKPKEPQIDIALGVYRDEDRTSYFYEGETDLQSTWIHEVTHQLFQETVPARTGVGKNVDFWMIEAVAMYLESTRFFDDYATVGGRDATRLDIARHRALEEKFYVPLHVISELGRDDLQRHPDIRRLYTQSAGFAHFFMDGNAGEFRSGFIQGLSDLYRRPGRNDPLWERLGVPSSKLDAMYRAFLGS